MSQYQRYLFLHFIPFVLAVVGLNFDLLSPTDLGTLLCALSLAYVGVCFRLLMTFMNALEFTRTTALPLELVWLRRVLYVYAVLVVYQCSRFLLGLVVSDGVRNFFDIGFFVGTVSLFALLIFQGLRQPSLVPTFTDEDLKLSEDLKGRPRGNISPDQMALSQKLNDLMAHSKPFLDPELTVGALAALMGINGRQLSELINDVYAYSFSELINRARVDEAKSLMQSDIEASKTILDIGMEAGFNSKSSFNFMFKRYAQQTPSEFRRGLIKQ